MKVWIDRDICEANLSTCLSCFFQLMWTGIPVGACIKGHEDNGSKDMTIFIHAKGQTREPLVIPKELQEMIIYEIKEGMFASKLKDIILPRLNFGENS